MTRSLQCVETSTVSSMTLWTYFSWTVYRLRQTPICSMEILLTEGLSVWSASLPYSVSSCCTQITSICHEVSLYYVISTININVQFFCTYKLSSTTQTKDLTTLTLEEIFINYNKLEYVFCNYWIVTPIYWINYDFHWKILIAVKLVLHRVVTIVSTHLCA